MREFSLSKGRTPTLHEVMLAEKADFEAKVQQGQKRKKWLKGEAANLRGLFAVNLEKCPSLHNLVGL
jgi:hypothetical protein